MPRGVYDRSKTKEQRATEKATSSVKAEKVEKRKYTKRAKVVEAPEAPVNVGIAVVRHDYSHDISLFNIFSNALPSIAGTDAGLAKKICAKLSSIVDRMAPDALPLPEVAEKVAQTKAEAIQAPIPASIPVPIPVPVPFNGSNPQS